MPLPTYLIQYTLFSVLLLTKNIFPLFLHNFLSRHFNIPHLADSKIKHFISLQPCCFLFPIP